MKTLTALLVGQVLLTLFLMFKLVNIDNRFDNYEAVANRPYSSAIDVVDSQSGYRPNMTSGLPEEKLREIIREELALAFEDARPVSSNPTTSQGRSLQFGPDYELQRVAVAQSIDYYVSVGRITGPEMSRLQQDIAQLNPDDRRVMMGAIVKAINNGQLDGQL